MALRHLKPLLGAFEHIDAAIEDAAGPAGCRDEFQSARARIVKMMRDAADGDSEKEGLFALLDEAMAGSLATLLVVPAGKIDLASGGLVGAVDALMREHPSERVRGLAGDVVRGWRAGVKAEIARASAKLDGLPSSPPPPPHDDSTPAPESDTTAKKIPVEQARSRPMKSAVVSSSSRRVSTAATHAPVPTKMSAQIVVATSSAKPSANMRAPTAVPAKPKETPVATSSVKPSVSMGAPSFVPEQPKNTTPVCRSG